MSKSPLSPPSRLSRSPCLANLNNATVPIPRQDFELTPGLIARSDAHRIYVELAYPNETLLTAKLVAAREAPQGRRNGSEGQGGESQGTTCHDFEAFGGLIDIIRSAGFCDGTSLHPIEKLFSHGLLQYIPSRACLPKNLFLFPHAI